MGRALSCSFGDFARGPSSLTLAPTFVSSFSMVTEHLRCRAPCVAARGRTEAVEGTA